MMIAYTSVMNIPLNIVCENQNFFGGSFTNGDRLPGPPVTASVVYWWVKAGTQVQLSPASRALSSTPVHPYCYSYILWT